MLQVRNRNHRKSRRQRDRGHGSAPAQAPQAPAEAPAEPSEQPPITVELHHEHRMRQSGGPDDRALYGCGCGYVFRADVTTSVGCPHCGTTQAW